MEDFAISHSFLMSQSTLYWLYLFVGLNDLSLVLLGEFEINVDILLPFLFAWDEFITLLGCFLMEGPSVIR